MSRALVVAAVALALAPSSVWSQGGTNLSWNDCGTFGQANAAFACDTNTGPPWAMIASFYPPVTLPEFVGLQARIDLRSRTDTLPQWWRHGFGHCRGSTGLAASFDFTSGPYSCVDFFTGRATGGFSYAYPEGPEGSRSVLWVSAGVPDDARGVLDEGVEYYAFKVNLLRSKTTGDESCAGCSVAMCIMLDFIQLHQPPHRNHDPMISNPADRNFVSWQGTDPTCPGVPVLRGTWGQVRNLYRSSR